jgi:hypothetical protein
MLDSRIQPAVQGRRALVRALRLGGVGGRQRLASMLEGNALVLRRPLEARGEKIGECGLTTSTGLLVLRFWAPAAHLHAAQARHSVRARQRKTATRKISQFGNLM